MAARSAERQSLLVVRCSSLRVPEGNLRRNGALSYSHSRSPVPLALARMIGMLSLEFEIFTRYGFYGLRRRNGSVQGYLKPRPSVHGSGEKLPSYFPGKYLGHQGWNGVTELALDRHAATAIFKVLGKGLKAGHLLNAETPVFPMEGTNGWSRLRLDSPRRTVLR